MKKIPSIFQRLERLSLVNTAIVLPECSWVFEKGAVMCITIKRDGTPLKYTHDDGWKQRRTLKSKLDPGSDGIPRPKDFLPCQLAPSYDDESKQWEWPGWVPLEKQFQPFLDEALTHPINVSDGFTFELCGPKINGNPEGLDGHYLFMHASEIVSIPENADITLELLYGILKTIKHEGIVIYSSYTVGSELRTAKFKRRDIGLEWPIKVEVATLLAKN